MGRRSSPHTSGVIVMPELKRNKNIRMTFVAIRKLAELSARAGKSEGDFLSEVPFSLRVVMRICWAGRVW